MFFLVKKIPKKRHRERLDGVSALSASNGPDLNERDKENDFTFFYFVIVSFLLLFFFVCICVCFDDPFPNATEIIQSLRRQQQRQQRRRR